MPRFYFHVRTAGDQIDDEEGSDFPDDNSAVAEAIRGARCLMRGEVARGTLCLDQSIEIHDADGQHVRSVPFAEALTIIGDGASPAAIRATDGTSL